MTEYITMDVKWIQIYQMISTLLLLLWKLGESVQQESGHLKSSACFYEQKKTLALNCSMGQMVKLNQIFYGYTSDNNTCQYGPGHCTMDLPDTELYPCIGMPECQINLPSGNSGRKIPKCQQFAIYAQANYQCIPDSSVTDICEPNDPVLTSQSGYITTPRYPNNYPNNKDCTIRVNTPYPTQRIKLYIIDLNLEKNETDCADWLHVFDGHRGATFCATRARMDPILLMDHKVEITFHSNGQSRMKGFWLFYEAYPYVEETTILPTVMSTAKTTPDSGHKPYVTETTISGSSTNYKTTDHTTSVPVTEIVYRDTALTVGAVLGVIISLLLVLTVIILVILLCKRKDHSSNVKVPSSTSCNSEAAFLHITNNCYAHNQSLPPISPTDYVNMNNHIYNSGSHVGECYNNFVNETSCGGGGKGKNVEDNMDYCNNKPYPIDDNEFI